MLEELTTGRPDEFKGELVIDYTITYFNDFVSEMKIDKEKYHPVGIEFSFTPPDYFALYILAVPKGVHRKHDGKRPIVKIKTKATLAEFMKSFVTLNARCFQFKQASNEFYEYKD